MITVVYEFNHRGARTGRPGVTSCDRFNAPSFFFLFFLLVVVIDDARKDRFSRKYSATVHEFSLRRARIDFISTD